MRVVGKGKNAVQEEDWLATTPKRGHDYVFKESGLDAEEANAFVENKVAEAEKNFEKVKGKAPKMGTNIAAYKEAFYPAYVAMWYYPPAIAITYQNLPDYCCPPL